MEELGYHNYGTRWWTYTDCPQSYKYFDLDSLYSDEYFESEDHMDRESASFLYSYMQDIYVQNFGQEFLSVLELGSGSGELTRQFYEYDLCYFTVEGTKAGWKKLMRLGIPYQRVIYEDLRFFEPLDKKFDLVVCTEVAEHIEPWFASKLVSVCVEHSKVVWFSAADENRPPHYHHPNEAPIEAWDNIFEFFGYRYVQLENKFDRADRLYISD